MPFKLFIAVGLPAVALVVAVCLFGGCEPGNPGKIPNPGDTTVTPPNPSLDGRLVGDWRTIYEDDDGTTIEITTLTASGNVITGGFFKVESYWIESWEKTGTWRTSNDTLYHAYEEYGVIQIDPMRYTISDNRAALVFCGVRYCDTTVAERVDAAAVKNQFGTVRNQDQALFTSTAYNDLMWILEGGDGDTLDFDMMYFWNGERYFGYEWYYDQAWYTLDSRLFLLGINDDGEVEKTVELSYNIRGSGSAARLSIRPILDDGGLGPEDIWLPAEYDDSDGGFYKSKQGKKAVGKRKGALSSPWLPKRAVQWNQGF